jgi:hypothetical protein
MKNLIEHISFVKGQYDFHKNQASRYSKDPERAARHEKTAQSFQNLLNDLRFFQEWQSSHPDWETGPLKQPMRRLALSWEEVEGLPPEVLAELSISESDRTEFNVISAIKEMGGVASLDRLIVYLYKQNGEIQKRLQLNQKLYRMAQKELIFNVPGKKGIYSSEPFTEEDASSLVL